MDRDFDFKRRHDSRILSHCNYYMGTAVKKPTKIKDLESINFYFSSTFFFSYLGPSRFVIMEIEDDEHEKV